MIKFPWRPIFITVFVFLSGLCNAADNNIVSPGIGLLQIGFALFVVLGLMALAAWAMKRLGPIASSNKIAMKVVGGVSVGNRERVVVVEVADQWLILGVTSNNINHLASLAKEENLLQQPESTIGAPFNEWLKRTIEKRNAANIEKSK